MYGRSWILGLVLGAAVLVAFPAMPQTAPEQWSDEIIVSAPAAGPAIWRLRKGSSEVLVIGILPVFPKAQTWRTRRIEMALKGANALITPATSRASFGDYMSMMSKKALPNRQTLKDSLPPDLNARYEATAARAGVSIKAFAHDKPVWAGARLRADVLTKVRLTDDEPTGTIVRLARRQNVPVRAAGKYKLSPVLRDVNAMSRDASETCLRRTLDDIDFDLDRAPKTAAAWAIGDTRTVLANYHGSALADCLEGSGMGAALMERSVTDAVDAISDALAVPGRTVAIVPLAPWLRKGGALDRLRAQGILVTAPAD
jgi:uncharacterized protein YbaP (TraB family)